MFRYFVINPLATEVDLNENEKRTIKEKNQAKLIRQEKSGEMLQKILLKEKNG